MSIDKVKYCSNCKNKDIIVVKGLNICKNAFEISDSDICRNYIKDIVKDREGELRKIINKYIHNFLDKNYDKDTGIVKIDDYGITIKLIPENPKYSKISDIFNEIMFEKMLSEEYFSVDSERNVVLTEKGKGFIKGE